VCSSDLPDIAVFGEKDFQQLLVIRQMVKDLSLPVDIIAGETKREANGLAMSSRNNYLSAEERAHAQTLRETLLHYRDQIEHGKGLLEAEKNCIKILENHGFIVDYITLRETGQLNEVTALSNDKNPAERVILAAVKLGKTRLIDNVRFVI